MENFYWLGYKIAFVLEIISITIGLTHLNSIRAKNLGKVGLYYSIYQGKFVEGKKSGIFSKITGIILALLINPFFSWIDVLIRGYSYVNILIQKLGTPEKLKEIQYKLGVSILIKEEVKELIKESANFLGKNIKFNDEDDSSEEGNTLILQDGGRYRDIELYNNKIYMNSHPDDYLSDFNSIYEYKIEGTKVYRKLLEDSTEHAGSEKYYDVKDGVVLESDIIERYNRNKNSMLAIMENVDEQIKKLKKDCERHEIRFFKTKYFILSKHPEIVSKEEFKKHIRSELEKIKLGKLKIKELCDKYKIELKYDKNMKFHVFRFINDKDRKTKGKDFEKKLEILLKQVKCERGEIEHNEEIIETLNGYLENIR